MGLLPPAPRGHARPEDTPHADAPLSISELNERASKTPWPAESTAESMSPPPRFHHAPPRAGVGLPTGTLASLADHVNAPRLTPPEKFPAPISAQGYLAAMLRGLARDGFSAAKVELRGDDVVVTPMPALNREPDVDGPLIDAPHVAQLLPDVPPWPELDQKPPGSCPGVGKPLVRRYEPPSFPSCAGCEMSWGMDTEVAPEHERSNCLTDQHLRRLDTWARAAGCLLGQLRRRCLEAMGAEGEIREELGKILGTGGRIGLFAMLAGRVQDVESRLAAALAGQGELANNLRALESHTLERLTAVEGRLDVIGRCLERFDSWANTVAPADSVVALERRVAAIERTHTDAQARPGFVRGHLGKALRHLASLVEKPK